MRSSGFQGVNSTARRPYVVCTPDVLVKVQGETDVTVCGDCTRKVKINDYTTQISTEASVDSPPGSCTITLSVPDTDVNNFFVDGELILASMMEIEVFSKGFFPVGGTSQYYRIFHGLISSVSKSWSNGTTTIQVSCKDMLRWWELTNVTVNPAFLEGFGSSTGNYTLFQNQFSGQNPYTTIIQLAKDAMGDFLLSTGSFTSFRPEQGPEAGVIASYSKNIMAYWNAKFSNTQSSLVLYGTSGQAYTFSGADANVSAQAVSSKIFEQEAKLLQNNLTTSLLFASPKEIATQKLEISRAGDVEFFQSDVQTKLQMALQARDQMGYEFYCDTTGDIVFKPPFYNLNVIPNKPVSWIQDHDIMDDSITESESEVITHVTASGNAFGGVTDWGLNDEITTPRTGVYDFHLLRRFGWRKAELQLEWAGNPRKLFFHLLDWMDRLNAKRQNGTVTIPLRPELRLGFPVWIPKYDAFYYVTGISHTCSFGQQATTTLTLSAKRSKFIAPNNLGVVKPSKGSDGSDNTKTTQAKVRSKDKKIDQTLTQKEQLFEISFPGTVGSTSGLSSDEYQGKPEVIRHPKTGKLLGHPNVVMVYRTSYNGDVLARILDKSGSSEGKNEGKKKSKNPDNSKFTYSEIRKDNLDILSRITQGEKSELLAKLRSSRYEAGMTNAGAYDYAFDESKAFRELALIPSTSISYGVGASGPDARLVSSRTSSDPDEVKKRNAQIDASVRSNEASIKSVKSELEKLAKSLMQSKSDLADYVRRNGSQPNDTVFQLLSTRVSDYAYDYNVKTSELDSLMSEVKILKSQKSNTKAFPSLNILIRPVSDEFGFEVIGHYRYGRGAYIDRGKIQIRTDDGSVANKITVPFSPTGGFLTDTNNVNPSSPGSVNTSALFDQMQPDDYVTGAYSKSLNFGDAYNGVSTTNQNTYSDLIERDRGKGTGLYIEADATKKAKTLFDMTPSNSSNHQSSASSCACSINNADWLSILPEAILKSVINFKSPKASVKTPDDYTYEGLQALAAKDAKAKADAQKLVESVISGATPEKQQETSDFVSEVLKSSSVIVSSVVSALTGTKTTNPTLLLAGSFDESNKTTSTVDSALSTATPTVDSYTNFFDKLNGYLVDTFNSKYKDNVDRENYYSGQSYNIEVSDPRATVSSDESNVLSPPNDALLQRAANGDTEAIKALQASPNDAFGLTQSKIKNFGSTVSSSVGNVSEATKKYVEDVKKAFKDPLSDKKLSPIGISTGISQPQPPSSSVEQEAVNPTKFSSATNTDLPKVPGA